MNKPDIVRLTYDQNPAMSEATQRMPLGEKLVIQLHCTLKSRDFEGVDLNIEAAVPEGYEIADDSDEPGNIALGSTNEPVMTPLAVMVRKKKAEERQKDSENATNPIIPSRTG